MDVAFGLPYVNEVQLYDERNTALHNRVSGITPGIACVVAVSVVPALYVLNTGGDFVITPELWGAIYLALALSILYEICRAPRVTHSRTLSERCSRPLSMASPGPQ